MARRSAPSRHLDRRGAGCALRGGRRAGHGSRARAFAAGRAHGAAFSSRALATQPNLGLALLAAAMMLALDRGFAPATMAAPETARQIAHPVSELFATAAWFDATTPLGAGLLGSAYALTVQRLWLGAEPGLWL